MPINRVFLGWNSPCVENAARFIADKHRTDGRLDCSNLTLVLPVSRATRRILELLVDIASEEKLLLTPPRILTAGELPEQLYRAPYPLASKVASSAAWIKALRNSAQETLVKFLPHPPPADDLTAWGALGSRLSSLWREVGGAGITFGDVAKRGVELTHFEEEERWNALDSVRTEYLKLLQAASLSDREEVRILAARRSAVSFSGELYLVGTSDLIPITRHLVGALPVKVTALVAAPEELSESFDEVGCLVREKWIEEKIELPLTQIVVAGGAASQAQAALRAVGGWNGEFAAHEVTVGVADPTLIPFVEERFSGEGLPVRNASGRALTECAPIKLLELVGNYAHTKSFKDCAALIRHPELESWIKRRYVEAFSVELPSVITYFDRYHEEHLPARLAGPLCGTSPSDEVVKRVVEILEGLTKPLAPGALGALTDVPKIIGNILGEIFGVKVLSRDSMADRELLDVCSNLQDLGRELASIPKSLLLGEKGAQLLTFALKLLKDAATRPEPVEAAIELLGWLELALDDAPALVITGMHEGIVPESINADSFLPEGLRRHLGLVDNEWRYARDSYVFASIVARAKKLVVVVGSSSPEGEPLLPSRLLLRGDEAQLPTRVEALYKAEAGDSSISLPGRFKFKTKSEFKIPTPLPLIKRSSREISVTAFRDYLSCPYTFYLKHFAKVDTVGDTDLEMGGDLFGTLAHSVLREFGRSSVKDSILPDVIEAFLSETLDTLFHLQFGNHALPTVYLQKELLRARLGAFSRWQAKWASNGWRIKEVEYEVPKSISTLQVGDLSYTLKGRIDRIDVGSRGEVAVFDYKTSDNPKTPVSAHEKARDGSWKDLQLPLYIYLLKREGRLISQDTNWRVGYIQLPKDSEKVGDAIAPWEGGKIDLAVQVAKELLMKIEAGEFSPGRTSLFPLYNKLLGIDQRWESVDESSDSTEELS